jgi:hypothetical protein
MLFHGGALAFSAKNASLTEQIRGQLQGVDAAMAKKLDELMHHR